MAWAVACLPVSPPAFLLLLSSLAVRGDGGVQGQLAPTQTSAQRECDGEQRAQCLSQFPGPGLEVAVSFLNLGCGEGGGSFSSIFDVSSI